MKLPKEVKVGPLTYKIVRVNQDEIPDDNAAIDVNDGLIRIRKRLRVDKLKMYLLHELVHACHLHAGKYDDVPRKDEEWIDATTPTLLQILIDNPKLIEFFQSVPPKKKPIEGTRKPEVRRLPVAEVQL